MKRTKKEWKESAPTSSTYRGVTLATATATAAVAQATAIIFNVYACEKKKTRKQKSRIK